MEWRQTSGNPAVHTLAWPPRSVSLIAELDTDGMMSALRILTLPLLPSLHPRWVSYNRIGPGMLDAAGGIAAVDMRADCTCCQADTGWAVAAAAFARAGAGAAANAGPAGVDNPSTELPGVAGRAAVVASAG